MSRYDGLIIPRSYSEYINKTDAATLQQALQLSGVLSGAVAAGDNKAVTSNAVNRALAGYVKSKTTLINASTNNPSGTITNKFLVKKSIISFSKFKLVLLSNASKLFIVEGCLANWSNFIKVYVDVKSDSIENISYDNTTEQLIVVAKDYCYIGVMGVFDMYYWCSLP